MAPEADDVVGMADGVPEAEDDGGAGGWGVDVADEEEAGALCAAGIGVLESDLDDEVDDWEEGRDWVALSDIVGGWGVAVLAG